ncbi:MAG: 50S ribosomal protein L24 [Candidatus Paceibacterota bacterium]
MKIKKNDQVLIISGDDKGKKGKVLRSFAAQKKILVEGINIAKKHVKPKKSGQKGQIAKVPNPIVVSKAKLLCPKCGKAARVGAETEGDKKFRVCKKCGQRI